MLKKKGIFWEGATLRFSKEDEKLHSVTTALKFLRRMFKLFMLIIWKVDIFRSTNVENYQYYCFGDESWRSILKQQVDSNILLKRFEIYLILTFCHISLLSYLILQLNDKILNYRKFFEIQAMQEKNSKSTTFVLGVIYQLYHYPNNIGTKFQILWKFLETLLRIYRETEKKTSKKIIYSIYAAHREKSINNNPIQCFLLAINHAGAATLIKLT